MTDDQAAEMLTLMREIASTLRALHQRSEAERAWKDELQAEQRAAFDAIEAARRAP